jgi:predicted metal-dependent phosphoesterase TrpH
MLDLHCHSTASDGAHTPTELVERAAGLGLRTLALTDHDTLAGLEEARQAGRRVGVEVLGGVEISATRIGGGSIHVLGYLFNEADPGLLGQLRLLNEGRRGRNVRIAARLTALGMPIEIEEVEARAQGTVGRPHFAQVMIDKGYVRTYEEAFDFYLAEGGSAYVEKAVLSPKQAIDTVHAAGGVAVLAHPLAYQRDVARLEKLTRELAGEALDGMEVRSGGNTAGEVAMLQCFADRYGLLALGGSDFHREPGPSFSPLPSELLDAMRARAEVVRARGAR